MMNRTKFYVIKSQKQEKGNARSVIPRRKLPRDNRPRANHAYAPAKMFEQRSSAVAIHDGPRRSSVAYSGTQTQGRLANSRQRMLTAANCTTCIDVVERLHRAGMYPDVWARCQELRPGPNNLGQLTVPEIRRNSRQSTSPSRV